MNKHITRTITYRAPFSVMGNNVIDGLGLTVAQFSTSEQILVGGVARDTAVVVAYALNEICNGATAESKGDLCHED